jgi:hypothetical protein
MIMMLSERLKFEQRWESRRITWMMEKSNLEMDNHPVQILQQLVIKNHLELFRQLIWVHPVTDQKREGMKSILEEIQSEPIVLSISLLIFIFANWIVILECGGDEDGGDMPRTEASVTSSDEDKLDSAGSSTSRNQHLEVFGSLLDSLVQETGSVKVSAHRRQGIGSSAHWRQAIGTSAHCSYSIQIVKVTALSQNSFPIIVIHPQIVTLSKI